jgi:hypothetical protein
MVANVKTQVSPPSPFVVGGKNVSMPVLLRDGTAISAVFVVPTAEVRRIIAAPRLPVPDLIFGRTLLSIACVEYKDCDLGVYNEVGITFMVQKPGTRVFPILGMTAGFLRKQVGAYVHRMPISLRFACDAGREIWGLPKTVEDITFSESETTRTCTLVMDGVEVMKMTATKGGSRRFANASLDALTCQSGVVRRIPFVSAGEGVGFRLGGGTISLGQHPVADELRALGLPKRPLMTTFIQKMQAQFDAPEIL